MINQEIEIHIHPENRDKYLYNILLFDGLGNIKEDPDAAYCPISLTNTPDLIKKVISERQQTLINILREAGITGYDPGSAPFSPDNNLAETPDSIYRFDSRKIAGARFFVGNNLLPSTGFGVELEKAVRLNRIPVILHDVNIRISRMQPSKVIYLQYKRIEDQKEDFIAVFKRLKEFTPGIGTKSGKPVLLGFKQGNSFDLEELIYGEFPHLKYEFDGNTPIAKFQVKNSEIFVN